MKVGIIGTGNIGATLAHKLTAAGYEVTIANSRGPRPAPLRRTSTAAWRA